MRLIVLEFQQLDWIWLHWDALTVHIFKNIQLIQITHASSKIIIISHNFTHKLFYILSPRHLVSNFLKKTCKNLQCRKHSISHCLSFCSVVTSSAIWVKQFLPPICWLWLILLILKTTTMHTPSNLTGGKGVILAVCHNITASRPGSSLCDTPIYVL